LKENDVMTDTIQITVGEHQLAALVTLARQYGYEVHDALTLLTLLLQGEADNMIEYIDRKFEYGAYSFTGVLTHRECEDVVSRIK
jgi:hypothetical protein